MIHDIEFGLTSIVVRNVIGFRFKLIYIAVRKQTKNRKIYQS